MGQGRPLANRGLGGPTAHRRFSRILLASSCSITRLRISRSKSWESEVLGAGGSVALGIAKWPRMIPSPKRAAAPTTTPSIFAQCIL